MSTHEKSHLAVAFFMGGDLMDQNMSKTAPLLALEALKANFACTPRV
jgi:hypothetical protein